MTGIERLRQMAEDFKNVKTAEHCTFIVNTWRGRYIDDSIADIADQIEREQDKVARTDWEAVRDVCDDMARHVSGIPEFDDLVDRWCRTLDGTLDGRAGSVHDTANDRSAVAWVREHGGLDAVRSEWSSRVPYDKHEQRRQRLLGHIAECEAALRRRNQRIKELGHRVSDLTAENAELRKRAMPEGYEWPLYEDGAPVQIGSEFVGKDGKTYTAKQIQFIGKCFSLYDFCDQKPQFNGFYGQRVRRPAVPAGDGEPLEVGQTVWDTDAEADTPLTVVEVSSDLVRCEYTWKDGKTYRPCYPPSVLTHTKPEIDSWERVEEDIADGFMATEETARDLREDARDIVRRCKAMAERERGE